MAADVQAFYPYQKEKGTKVSICVYIRAQKLEDSSLIWERY
jgi:hypothetical protein